MKILLLGKQALTVKGTIQIDKIQALKEDEKEVHPSNKEALKK